jgi:hypothetical protein
MLSRRPRPSLVLIAGFTLALALFALTLHPGVGGRVNHGDSAKFQFIGVVAGISHPPGNPLYLLFNVALAHVPLGAPCVRASFLSAFFGAVAVSLVAGAAAHLRGRLAGFVSGAMLAFGSLFWTLSTEAEVYTLNAALLAGSLYALCRWETDRRERWLLLGLVAFVLGFANHLTMVAALPALALVAWRVHRERPLGWRLYRAGAVTAAVALALYAYVPLRYADALYSEFDGTLTARSFWQYVTARKFSGDFGLPTVAVLVHERMPRMMTLLEQQWLWPAWVVVGLGIERAAASTRAAGCFVFLAVAGFLGFALLYDIQDPEGFYVPVVSLAAFALAFAVPKRRSHRAAFVGLLGFCVAPVASVHLSEWRSLGDRGVIEGIAGDPPVLWDMPDLVRRVPAHADIVLPCNHYGCVETWNYFRFGDAAAREKHLGWVQMTGGLEYGSWGSQPLTIRPEDARSRVVCTLRESDAEKMRSSGARMEKIARPEKQVAGKAYAGMPIWCSKPTGS